MSLEGRKNHYLCNIGNVFAKHTIFVRHQVTGKLYIFRNDKLPQILLHDNSNLNYL